MLLNLMQRQMIFNVLPKTGSIAEQLICKEIMEKLKSLTDEHKEKINYKAVEGNPDLFTFDRALDEAVDFVWSESELHVLKRGVDILDKEEAVTMELLDICKEIREM